MGTDLIHQMNTARLLVTLHIRLVHIRGNSTNSLCLVTRRPAMGLSIPHATNRPCDDLVSVHSRTMVTANPRRQTYSDYLRLGREGRRLDVESNCDIYQLLPCS